MAGQTSTFAIDNAQEYAVTANTNTSRVEIHENYDSASAPVCDLVMARPFGGTGIKIAKGTSAIFARTAAWQKGDTVGSIKTSSGSCTVAQIESEKI